MQYPPLTQFGQTNLANSIFVTSQPPLLALQYVLKLKANPENPAFDVVFNPKHQELYKNKD